MKKIALIAALEKERVLIEQALGEGRREGGCFVSRHGDLEVIVASSGIAKVNAAVCTTELIGLFHPDAVINSGVAGGCGPDVKPLDVVAGKVCAYHDVWCLEPNAWGQVEGLPARFEADRTLLDKAVALGARPVLICTGDIFATKPDVERIRVHFPEVEAVDMESAAIAQVCHLKNVPFLSLRVISDNADADSNTGQYLDFWDRAPQATFRLVRSLIASL